MRQNVQVVESSVRMDNVDALKLADMRKSAESKSKQRASICIELHCIALSKLGLSCNAISTLLLSGVL